MGQTCQWVVLIEDDVEYEYADRHDADRMAARCGGKVMYQITTHTDDGDSYDLVSPNAWEMRAD